MAYYQPEQQHEQHDSYLPHLRSSYPYSSVLSPPSPPPAHPSPVFPYTYDLRQPQAYHSHRYSPPTYGPPPPPHPLLTSTPWDRLAEPPLPQSPLQSYSSPSTSGPSSPESPTLPLSPAVWGRGRLEEDEEYQMPQEGVSALYTTAPLVFRGGVGGGGDVKAAGWSGIPFVNGPSPPLPRPNVGLPPLSIPPHQSAHSPDLPGPPTKPLACTACRQSHLRCSRTEPCNQCVRKNRPCVFSQRMRKAVRKRFPLGSSAEQEAVKGARTRE